jgi:hypothetical protein
MCWHPPTCALTLLKWEFQTRGAAAAVGGIDSDDCSGAACAWLPAASWYVATGIHLTCVLAAAGGIDRNDVAVPLRLRGSLSCRR